MYQFVVTTSRGLDELLIREINRISPDLVLSQNRDKSDLKVN